MFRLMGRLKSANLTVCPDKCHFLKTTVTYLGHIISEKGVEPDPSKVSAVFNFPRPKNRKNIKQFLGLAGYYRRFVKDFAKIAKPLTSLLKADTPWDWTDVQEEASASYSSDDVEHEIRRVFFILRPTTPESDSERDYVLHRQNNGLQGMQLAIEAPTPDQNAPTEANDATLGNSTEEASSDSPASESSPREHIEDATSDSASDESDAEDEATFTHQRHTSLQIRSLCIMATAQVIVIDLAGEDIIEIIDLTGEREVIDLTGEGPRRGNDLPNNNNGDDAAHDDVIYICKSNFSNFRPGSTISIYTDASLQGLGAVLKQPQSDNNIKPVFYFSRKLTEAQKKKKAIFIECLAIKEAILYWQYYLIGQRFTIFTDHKPLENFNIKKCNDPDLVQILNYLSQFDFEVVYNPGNAASCDMCSTGSMRSSVSDAKSGATDNSVVDSDDNDDNGGSSSVGSRSGDEAMDVERLPTWATRSQVSPAAPAADNGRGESADARGRRRPKPLRILEQPPHANNEHQNAEAPVSPDPAVNRGFACKPTARASRHVNSLLAAPTRAATAGADRNAGASDEVEGRSQSLGPNGVIEAESPNRGSSKVKRGSRPARRLLQPERELLEFMFDGFSPNFALVEACDHALLWAFDPANGRAWRGHHLLCFELRPRLPGLREVVIHQNGPKRRRRKRAVRSLPPDVVSPRGRVVAPRHCDMCKRIIVLNQDAILSRRILESSPAGPVISSASAPVATQPSPAATPGGLVGYYCEDLCLPTSKCTCITARLIGRKVEPFDEGTTFRVRVCASSCRSRVRPLLLMGLHMPRGWLYSRCSQRSN
ncbi:unnamed protein product [Trichogramma brassicae]|uniref:RNA-directed DNA polymerase n=1 Tax=Trichogramma brassicae TaxID=86971 RepID=A0A6H5J2Y1_9HYME|nr:unnamed protein product [Trichogramma brassicae]